MKIIRHLTPSGPAYAELRPDGTCWAIAGELFGHYSVTSEQVTPGKRLAPVAPSNILCIGLNYRKHAEEAGKGVPERPMIFIKGTNAVQNPDDPVELPVHLASHEVDYETELAVVIGKTCKNATRANALSFVLGYTVGNDISARDWQFRLNGGQFCQGKSFDTFCPLGPVLVTADELPNPNSLRLTTKVNGEVRQDSNTSDMVFDVASLIEFLSGSKTLLPGTIIMTGTPSGVGYARKPPVFLKAGDVVSSEIEKIGVLSNPIANERV